MKMRNLFAALWLFVAATPALAQAPIMAPDSSSQRVGVSSSANGAGGVVATLPAQVGKFTHLCGFSVDAGNPTAGITVSVTVTGIVGGPWTFDWTALAAAATTPPPAPLFKTFYPCVPSAGQNTAIVVTVPTLGAGEVGVSVNAWGFQWDRSNN